MQDNDCYNAINQHNMEKVYSYIMVQLYKGNLGGTEGVPLGVPKVYSYILYYIKAFYKYKINTKTDTLKKFFNDCLSFFYSIYEN